VDIWLFSNQSEPTISNDITKMPKDGFVWILANTNEMTEAMDKAEQLAKFSVHEQHRQDCANSLHPAAFDTVKDYDLLIIRALAEFDIDSVSQQTNQACFLISKRLLVTIADNHQLFTAIQNKIQISGARMQYSLDDFLYYILKQMIDAFMVLRKTISSQLLMWQKLLLAESGRFNQWQKLLTFKNHLRWLNLLMEEQVVALDEWEEDIAAEITDSMAVRIRDLQDHTNRVLKMASRADREIDALIQLHYTMLSKKTSDIMRVLTVISAIFLPLTLITGFFGMNFNNLPFVETHAGSHLIVLTMLVLALILVGVFRWKKWL